MQESFFPGIPKRQQQKYPPSPQHRTCSSNFHSLLSKMQNVIRWYKNKFAAFLIFSIGHDVSMATFLSCVVVQSGESTFKKDKSLLLVTKGSLSEDCSYPNDPHTTQTTDILGSKHLQVLRWAIGRMRACCSLGTDLLRNSWLAINPSRIK